MYNGVEIYVKDINRTVTLRRFITYGICDLRYQRKHYFYPSIRIMVDLGVKCAYKRVQFFCNTRVYPNENHIYLHSELDTLTYAKQAAAKSYNTVEKI